MALGVPRRVDPVAIELVGGLARDDGAGSPRPRTMGIDALGQMDVDRLRVAAADRGRARDVIAPFRPDYYVAFAQAHLRMADPALGVGDEHAPLEAEGFLQPSERG